MENSPNCSWVHWEGSIRRPTASKAGTLSTELHPAPQIPVKRSHYLFILQLNNLSRKKVKRVDGERSRSMPKVTTLAWPPVRGNGFRRTSCPVSFASSWQRWRSAWVWTRPMCEPWSTTTCRRVSKATSRRSGALDETATHLTATCSSTLR